ncbi:MAG: hypothetical protein D6710_12030 [Nitrospirae bacterium]|nr:MAG: hypothetical protein D6710_12030 [Nitrospirota bacterium]
MARKKKNYDWSWVYWICDVIGCEHINHRRLSSSEIIIDDICDVCREKIHEPIVYEVDPELGKYRGETSISKEENGDI